MAKESIPTLGEIVGSALEGLNRCLPATEADDKGCGGCPYDGKCMDGESVRLYTGIVEDARAALTAVQIKHKQLAAKMAEYAWPPNRDSSIPLDPEKLRKAWEEVLDGEF